MPLLNVLMRFFNVLMERGNVLMRFECANVLMRCERSLFVSPSYFSNNSFVLCVAWTGKIKAISVGAKSKNRSDCLRTTNAFCTVWAAVSSVTSGLFFRPKLPKCMTAR